MQTEPWEKNWNVAQQNQEKLKDKTEKITQLFEKREIEVIYTSKHISK